MKQGMRHALFTPRFQLELVVLITLLVGVGCYWYYRSETEAVIDDRYDEVAAIGKLKASQIQQWRKERRLDAIRFSQSGFMRKKVAEFLRHPNDAKLQAELLQRLQLEREAGEYANVLLFAPDLSLVLASGNDSHSEDSALPQTITAALSTHEPAFSEVCRSCIDVAVALEDAAGQPMAVAVLCVNPVDSLFPMVRFWPTKSHSGETILARHDGADAVFLNSSRFLTNTTTGLRVSLSDTNIGKVQAVLGRQGMFIGKDYRGVEVLADLRPIPDSPWYVISKVDMSEILVVARRRALLVSLIVVLFVLLSITVVVLLYRRRQVAIDRNLNEAKMRRKEAEDNLGKIEARWQFALDGAGDGVWDWNIQTGEVFYSRQLKVMLGYQEDELVHRIEAWEQLVHPDDKARCQSDLNNYFSGKAPAYLNEHRLRCKEGTYKWILDRGKIIEHTHDGKPLRAIGTHTDISARKQAEVTLAASVSLLNVTLESTANGILVVDLQGRIIRWNQKFADLWQIPPDIMADRSDDRALGYVIKGVADPDQFITRVREYYANPELTGTDEIQLTDGRVLDRYSQPQKIGDAIVGRVWSFSDITARKRAEQRLRLQGSALEAAANAIVIADRAGMIEWANAAFARFTGYEVADMIGTKCGAFIRSGKHDRAFYKNMWNTILGGGVWQGEVINLHKDGRLYTEDMTITPLKDEQGEVTHFIAVKQDVTARKVLEEELRQAQKMEAFGQLAGGVAHDFNNILTVIQGNATLMQMGAGAVEADHALQQIIQASGRAAALTRQLLALSRRQVMQTRVINLNDVVSSMGKMFQRLIGENITLQTQLLPGGAAAKADPGMIEQVLLNLVVNARDAMPEGGRVEIALHGVVFDGKANAQHHQAYPGDFIRLEVRDTGKGIPPEILPRIFEPFFTTKDVGKGTGLGLATVHGIVQQHHGWVEVESQPGNGTTFQVYLPRLVEGMAQLDADESTTVRVRGGKECIMLVEDDEHLRRLTSRALAKYGYRVIEVASGAMALSIWKEHCDTVDLLLTDIIMPDGISGRQLVEQLQAEKPGLKSIYMSGYPGEVAGRGLDLREGQNFLAKPFVPTKLAQIVRDCLDASLKI